MARHTFTEDRERARQAGYGRQQKRGDLMRQRMAAARTPDARLGQAFDWLRGSCKRMATRRRTRTGFEPNRAAAERIMCQAADYLAALAAEVDGGLHDAE